jgi:ubiquinone/menaquinone biosynthesis C-methylase UbiE
MLLQRFALRLLRWGFHRLYREFAWAYDLVAWGVSLGHWRDWALAALPYLRGRVLELGPGTGYVQAALAGNYPHLALALEASPQMITQTQRRLRRHGYTALLLRGLAQNIPFAAGSVDTVLATFPAEYILDPQTAREVARVLVPTGRLVIVDGGRISVERSIPTNKEGAASCVPIPPAPAALSAFSTLGFRFTTHWETVGKTQVMVLVGERGTTNAAQC